MSSNNKALFIFRRDLRLEDNAALITALHNSNKVIPCFIFDPRQIGDQPYKSLAAVQFMLESLLDLEGQLKAHGAKLYLFEGKAQDVIHQLIKMEHVDAVYVNRDYTPFSQRRDQDIAKVCAQEGINLHSFDDAMLNPPELVKKNDGGVYTIYTPYCRKAMTYAIAKPVSNKYQNYYQRPIAFEDRKRVDAFEKMTSTVSLYPGGRREALKIIKDIGGLKNYDEERNFPALHATSKLSPHHKFGTCSIREVYHAVKDTLGIDHTLIRELFWRDFFTQIGFHFPHVLGKSFHAQYDGIQWQNNPKHFQMWCEGKTGFPIVDAGIRELNQTGFMHNRVRMIAASFLVKDLHIDWRLGEKYFASKLVDYDPLVNNGNWQWVASTGCDAQPYFRIFNPWLQQEKFDPKAIYIKHWVPELKDAKVEDIHQIEKKGISFNGYPKPIIWHEGEKATALTAYRLASKHTPELGHLDN